ncbi:MAG TPA: NUDIX domain-containing protein [Thermoplasmata archaeon]|nr:NUDIX domain-containing protein [Thermoplasmata archaeon]
MRADSGPPAVQECVEGYLYTRAPFRVLLLRRPPSRGSIWVPVSGKVEPSDPDFESALRRELSEETGLTDPVGITPLDWTVEFDGPDGRRWRLHGYAVELAREALPRLSEEHEAYAWVDLAEAIRRLHYPDNREALDRLARSLRPGGSLPPAPKA